MRFHALLLKRIRIGKISKRPNTMQRHMTSLLRAENDRKLPIGPISSNPGPVLLTQVKTAVKEVEKEKLSNEMMRVAPSVSRK